MAKLLFALMFLCSCGSAYADEWDDMIMSYEMAELETRVENIERDNDDARMMREFGINKPNIDNYYITTPRGDLIGSPITKKDYSRPNYRREYGRIKVAGTAAEPATTPASVSESAPAKETHVGMRSQPIPKGAEVEFITPEEYLARQKDNRGESEKQRK